MRCSQLGYPLCAKSIESFIEDQAFPPSYDLTIPSPPHPPPPVSLSQSSRVSPVGLTDGTGEGIGEMGKPQIIRQREVWYSTV
jgi:hypothetical protein